MKTVLSTAFGTFIKTANPLIIPTSAIAIAFTTAKIIKNNRKEKESKNG